MKTTITVLAILLALAPLAMAADVDVNGINWDPTPIQAGQSVTIYFHLYNRSNSASGPIGLAIEWPNGFDLEKDYFGSGVDTINPSQAVVARYDLRVKSDTPQGHYQIKVRTLEGNNPIREQSFFLSVNNDPQLQLVGASVISVQPGQSDKINLTIRNVGHGPSDNIIVNFGSPSTITATGVVIHPDVIPLGSSSQLIDSLEAGKEATVSFPVTVSKSAALGVFTMPVILNYENHSGTAFSSSAQVGLTIVSEPEVDTVLAESVPPVAPGSTSKLTFNVFNVGSAAAKYLVADVKPFEGATLSVQKLFVGTLEADDFDSFTLDLTLPADAALGEKNLIVTLDYKDDTGSSRIKAFEIPIQVIDAKTANGANNQTPPLTMAIIAIVVLAILYFGYKRLKPKKKNGGE